MISLLILTDVKQKVGLGKKRIERTMWRCFMAGVGEINSLDDISTFNPVCVLNILSCAVEGK